jgi:hypothetical protein
MGNSCFFAFCGDSFLFFTVDLVLSAPTSAPPLSASLKGQTHEKVYEFLTWDGSFSLNQGSPTLFKILKSPV